MKFIKAAEAINLMEYVDSIKAMMYLPGVRGLSIHYIFDRISFETFYFSTYNNITFKNCFFKIIRNV